MIMSTATRMTSRIIHTDAPTHSHAHTRVTQRRIPVVKLVGAIGGIDWFAIKPCHCCHLNFGLCENHKLNSHSHTPTRVLFSVPRSSEWKMKQISSMFFYSFSIPANGSLGKMIYKTKKRSHYLTFTNASHLFNQAFCCEIHPLLPTQSKAHEGP